MHEDMVLMRLILWQLNQDTLLLQYPNKVPSECNTKQSFSRTKIPEFTVIFQKNYAHGHEVRHVFVHD